MIQIGGRPEAGFDNPIQMLSDCHRRIERFLEGFLRVARTAGERLTDTERAALEAALAYFAESGPRHTADEDESLFPRLRAHADRARVRTVWTLVEALEREHGVAHAYHDEAEARGRRWLRDGELPAAERALLCELLSTLREIYRRHIHLEDEVVFPVAAEVLTAEEASAVGREMADRRGVRFPG